MHPRTALAKYNLEIDCLLLGSLAEKLSGKGHQGSQNPFFFAAKKNIQSTPQQQLQVFWHRSSFDVWLFDHAWIFFFVWKKKLFR